MPNKLSKIDPVSRREFLRDAGMLAGGAILGSTLLMTACAGKETTITKTVTGPGTTQTVTGTVTVTNPATGGVAQTVTTTVTAPGTTVTGTGTGTTAPATKTGWGIYNYPKPAGMAFVECDEMKCVGCGACQMACSFKHYGLVNNSLSRIDVRVYGIPIPKAIQTTCCMCPDTNTVLTPKTNGPNDRLCVVACPTSPKSISWDEKTLHLVINKATCLGQGCLLCQKACPAKAIKFFPGYDNDGITTTPKPFVCDLCDTKNTGARAPACIDVCPNDALYWKDEDDRGRPVRDLLRRSPDDKATEIARRMYPLPRTTVYLRNK